MKQNYAVALDSCYMFTKKNVEHGIKHDIYSAYGVYINNTFLNFKAVSMNTLQFKQMMNLTNRLVCNIIMFGEVNLLQTLTIPKSLEYSKALPLNRIDYCGKTFANLRE